MNTPSRPTRHTQTKASALAVLGLGIIAQTASAADVTWVGNTSNLWNTGANWSTSAIPTNGSTLVFGAAGSGGVALSDDIAALTVGGAGLNAIVFGPSAASYTITRPGSQAITLASTAGGLAIKDTSLFAQTWSVPLTMTADQTAQIGDTTGAALSSLSMSTNGWLGGYRLTKTGTGILSLGNNNVLSGLTINQGTVNIASDGQLSTTAPASVTPAWLVLNGGTLRTNVNAGFTINANRGIALGDGSAGSGGTINVYASNGSAANLLTLTYNGVIADNGGANSLTKTGTQILALGGTNTYTGATKVNQGELLLDFTAATAPTSNIINSASSLVLGDSPTSVSNTAAGAPILLVQGSNTAATSQTFNNTVINQGYSSIVARGGSSTFDTVLNLRNFTHTAGGTVGISLLTGGSTGKGVITTTTANTNGILGGWATTSGAAVSGTGPLTQTDWAANDGSGNIVAYTGYTVPTGATPTVASNAAANVRIDGTSTGNVSLAFASNLAELNTIQVTDTAARVLAIGAGNTLRLGNYGGIWKSAAVNTSLTIGASLAQGGTLTAGGAANTAGEIVFNTNGVASTNQTITVNSVIADNGTGAVSLTKTGIAFLVLNGSNTYSGGTFVNQGTILATSANAFGGSGRDVTVLAGAQVSLSSNGGLTFDNNFYLAGSALTLGGNGGATISVVGNTVSGTVTLIGDTTIGNSGTNGTISGKITGDYSLSFIGGAILSNTANDYSGNLGINGITGALGGNPVTLKLGNNEVLANGAGKGNVYITGSSTAGNYSTLDLNGKTETINGLVSAGTAAQARILNNGVVASTLTLGDNNQSATFAGTIMDGTSTVRIVKIGSGVQTFSGLNTYSGGTAVNAGTLAVGASFTMSGANQVTLAATGLAGVNYATVKSTAGTLTFGGTLDINVTLLLSGGESFTVFSANGGALAGGFSNVSLTGSYIGSLTNNSGTWTGTVNGIDFTFATSGVNAGLLSTAASAVPEPSTYAAIFGGVALVGAAFFRRRAKAA